MTTHPMPPQAIHFGPASRRLFGVMHPVRGPVQGAVVMCPPLLHEHVRSYRFFSLLAARLAETGVACLRFDYFGTGDSDGETDAFTPGRAIEDIVEASARLRTRAGDVPLALLGIRASALFAQHAFAAAYADSLWCWQPVYDGASHIIELDALQRCELDSRARFPHRTDPAPVLCDDLMGFRLAPGFREGLSAMRLRPQAPLTMSIVDSDPPANDFLDGDFHALSPDATAWAGEIDMRGLIPMRDAERVIDALCLTLPAMPSLVTYG